MQDNELSNIKSKLKYLEDEISKLKNLLGFNHSGINSVKARLELLESYSIVDDHNEFNDLFGKQEIFSSSNLFCSYLIKKLKRMYEIVSMPPSYTKVRKGANEIYHFNQFSPYDKIEKLFHQSLLLLLFVSPSLTADLQLKVLQLIYHLRTCYVVVPEIITWTLKENNEDLLYVKNNFKKVIEALKKVK
jgi:hypothetical protein